jgi:hypothetical protein
VNNVTAAATPRQPLNERVITTGVIRRTAPLPPETLAAVITEHKRALSSHNGHEAQLAFDALGVDVDEGRWIDIDDAAKMAITITALAATIARLRAASVALDDVPPQSLRSVMSELQERTVHELPTQEAHTCIECGEESCICWAYDETLPAPVDVHPANRRAEAHSIQQAQRRKQVAS